MEIQGKIIQLLEPQQINTKNGIVNKYGFIIETLERFSQKIHFQVFGEEKWEKMNLTNSVNLNVIVSFDVSSREWNGKWYTQCDAWKVVVEGMQTQAKAEQQAQQPPQNEQKGTQENEQDPLPF